ncbi:hypothetical protein CHM34_13325 [Paludifilum halophilum]|uniref:DUF4181 domain-containing protein n=1 Tax=Paludifilum halophilum TaxID=1642702 RepID=A0A235B4U9_9BACL|nr:hypothetical protein CHM34_13325 [Paludifilum halophilum]
MFNGLYTKLKKNFGKNTPYLVLYLIIFIALNIFVFISLITYISINDPFYILSFIVFLTLKYILDMWDKRKNNYHDKLKRIPIIKKVYICYVILSSIVLFYFLMRVFGA